MDVLISQNWWGVSCEDRVAAAGLVSMTPPLSCPSTSCLSWPPTSHLHLMITCQQKLKTGSNFFSITTVLSCGCTHGTFNPHLCPLYIINPSPTRNSNPPVSFLEVETFDRCDAICMPSRIHWPHSGLVCLWLKYLPSSTPTCKTHQEPPYASKTGGKCSQHSLLFQLQLV